MSGGAWVDAGREYVHEDNGWTRWAPATQVIEVPGDHELDGARAERAGAGGAAAACVDAAEAAAADREPRWTVEAAE